MATLLKPTEHYPAYIFNLWGFGELIYDTFKEGLKIKELLPGCAWDLIRASESFQSFKGRGRPIHFAEFIARDHFYSDVHGKER